MTILRQIVYYLAQKAAANPEAREKVMKAARGVIQKTQQIAKDNDRAYAAGRAVRKALDRMKSKQ